MTKQKYFDYKKKYFTSPLYDDAGKRIGFIAKSDVAIPELDEDVFVLGWFICDFYYLYHIYAPSTVSNDDI